MVYGKTWLRASRARKQAPLPERTLSREDQGNIDVEARGNGPADGGIPAELPVS
jgi:hypothetical protein